MINRIKKHTAVLRETQVSAIAVDISIFSAPGGRAFRLPSGQAKNIL